MTSSFDRPVRLITAGIVSGLAAGACMAAYLLAATAVMDAVNGFPSAIAAGYEFTAAALVGPSARGNPAYIPLGIALHFAVSIGWALGYVYLARTQPALVNRPVLSGVSFGLVVFFAMQVVLVAANTYVPPTPRSLLNGLIAHCVFYGIPLGLVAARYQTHPADASTR